MNVIEKEFDEKAEVYESYRLAGWYKAHAEILLDILPKNFSGSIIDIGCGTGFLLRKYLAGNPNARGVGIDISSGMIEVACREAGERGISSAEFIHADWETFELDVLGIQQFDLVVCANTYHYFANPKTAAGKMNVILRDGGAVFLIERNKAWSPLTILWDLLHKYLIRDNVAFYDQNAIINTLECAGFADSRTLRHIKKYFWHGKMFTNIVILGCIKLPSQPTH